MLKIFILIFAAGLVLYIASAILVKIDENRRFKEAKKFNSDKIIDRYMEYIGQRTNNFDKASLSVTEHDNPAFMNGNSKLQQFLLRSNP